MRDFRAVPSEDVMRKKVLSLIFFFGLWGCTHPAEETAVREFSRPSPTSLCRVDNIRAIKGNGIIVSGLFKYNGESLRHVTAYKETAKGLRRLDLTCPECQEEERIVVVYVKDYHITKIEEPVHEVTNPVKLAYIRKALEIEERKALQTAKK